MSRLTFRFAPAVPASRIWPSLAVALSAATVLADIDRSFDFPGMPPRRNLVVQVAAGDRARMLGDVALNQAATDAIANMNAGNSAFRWTLDNNAANPDIIIRIDNGLQNSGGASTGGFANVDAMGRLRGPLNMRFNQNPTEGWAWGSMGAQRLDPVAVVMHELTHSGRLDHMMMNLRGTVYFNPIRPGERPNNRMLTQQDINALNGAGAAAVNRANRPNFMGGPLSLIVPEAEMHTAEGAIIGQGDVSFGHATDQTVPDELALLTNERVIWGGNLLLEGGLELDSGAMRFLLNYREDALLEWFPGKGVNEATLRPVIYDPLSQIWRDAGFFDVSLDPNANSLRFGLDASAAQPFLSSDGRLIVGAAGVIPEPASAVLLAVGLVAVRFTRRRA